MNLSSILRSKFKADRKAAIALDRAVRGVKEGSYKVLKDIHAGAERISWYSSCLFDKYTDICSELKTEDKRMVNAIFEIYKRRDIINDMINIYLDEELKSFNHSQIQSIDKSLTKIISGYRNGKITKAALANPISIHIAKSFGFRNEILIKMNKSTTRFVTALSFYGKAQKAALEARKLRLLHPKLYWDLYEKKYRNALFFG